MPSNPDYPFNVRVSGRMPEESLDKVKKSLDRIKKRKEVSTKFENFVLGRSRRIREKQALVNGLENVIQKRKDTIGY
jgi:hypothetical protein